MDNYSDADFAADAEATEYYFQLEIEKLEAKIDLLERKLQFIDDNLRTSLHTFSNKILDQAKEMK